MDDAQQEKFAMAHEPTLSIIDNDKISNLANLIDKDKFRFESVARQIWLIGFLDDKNLFDEHALNLATAMQIFSPTHFHIAIVDQISLQRSSLSALTFIKTAEAIEEFQIHYDVIDGLTASFCDCVMFDDTLEWAVIRTGDVRYTAYAGSREFVMTALGH